MSQDVPGCPRMSQAHWQVCIVSIFGCSAWRVRPWHNLAPEPTCVRPDGVERLCALRSYHWVCGCDLSGSVLGGDLSALHFIMDAKFCFAGGKVWQGMKSCNTSGPKSNVSPSQRSTLCRNEKCKWLFSAYLWANFLQYLICAQLTILCCVILQSSQLTLHPTLATLRLCHRIVAPSSRLQSFVL